MKKALIFDPYLDTLGGGEVYTLKIAEFLLKKGFQIDLAWKEGHIFNKIYHRFNLNLKNRVKINKKAYFLFTSRKNILKKFVLTRNYNIIFYLSDGSMPFLFGKSNFVHFQVPFRKVNGRSTANKLKLKNIKRIICNSSFTKKHIDKEFKVNSKVVYPPVNAEFLKYNPVKKENIILSVGRFDQILNAKKQDILVGTFKKMVDRGLENWQLVLLGGLREENKYFDKLKSQSAGYPIVIIDNASFAMLRSYYLKARIYWHACGYNENLEKNPQRGEHFGITIIEAMASGCVPIVFNGGGLLEIVKHQVNGFLWNNLEELEKITLRLIKNPKKLSEISKQAVLRSKDFDTKNFENKLEEVFFRTKDPQQFQDNERDS